MAGAARVFGSAPVGPLRAVRVKFTYLIDKYT
jgi:hypothetical protein